MDTPPMNPEFRKSRKKKFTWEILEVFPPAGSYQGMESLNQQFEPCTLQTQQPLKPVNVLVTRELSWQPRMTLNPKQHICRCNSMHFDISKKESTKSYFEEAQESLLKQEMGVHWMPGTSPQTFAPLIRSPLLGNGCWLPESCCIQQTILLDMRPVVLGTYTCVSKTQHCLYLQSFQKMCNPRTRPLRQQMRQTPLTENLGQNLKHKTQNTRRGNHAM